MSDQSPDPQGQPYAQPNPQDPYAQPYLQGQPYPQPYPQQPYPQAPYGQPYPPQYYSGMPSQPSNTMAIVSLIAGIVGLILFPIVGSVVAVITGHMARKQIRETGEGGDGMALGGVITGWIGLGLYLLVGLFFVVIFLAASSTAAIG